MTLFNRINTLFKFETLRSYKKTLPIDVIDVYIKICMLIRQIGKT